MNLRFVFLVLIFVTGFLACEDDGGGSTITPVMGTIEPNVGGPEQPNQVYVDLSANETTVVARNSWDFGFSNGSDFNVILNSSNGMLAVATEESDFANVSNADTAMFLGSVQNLDAIFGILVGSMGNFPGWFSTTKDWIDSPDGDLTATAFDAVSSIASDNKVYIVNLGSNPDGSKRGFIKMLVNQNGGGYEVVHGSLDDAVGTTVQIDKESDTNFNFLSVANGIVSVQPASDAWDIAFSTYSDYVLSNFSSGFPVPYQVNDFVFSNRENVSIATVMSVTNVVDEYTAFSLAEATALSYNSAINAIGTDWRTVMTQDPTTVTAVRSDRFYIVNDGAGSYFKVLFTQMTNDSGERGYPEFTFEELK